MFRLRHIYVHELVDFDKPDRTTIGEALESSVSFLKAAAEVVGNLLHPNAPLTQTDMNQRSAEDLAALDGKIEAVLEELSSLVDGDRRALLSAGQTAWMEFRHRQAEYEAGIYRGGTIYPFIFGGAAQSLCEGTTGEPGAAPKAREGRTVSGGDLARPWTMRLNATP